MTTKKTPTPMTTEEKRVWAMACRHSRRNFNLKLEGARVSYAAGFYNCYFYLKRHGMIKNLRELLKVRP